MECAAFENKKEEGGAAAFENKKEEEKDVQWPLLFQVFTFSGAVTYLLGKQCSLSTNFRIAEHFNLDYVIHFYIPKKEL